MRTVCRGRRRHRRVLVAVCIVNLFASRRAVRAVVDDARLYQAAFGAREHDRLGERCVTAQQLAGVRIGRCPRPCFARALASAVHVLARRGHDRLWLASTGVVRLERTFVMSLAGSCAFCGKDRAEVHALVGTAGHASRICDECVGLCCEIIGEEVGLQSPRELHADVSPSFDVEAFHSHLGDWPPIGLRFGQISD